MRSDNDYYVGTYVFNQISRALLYMFIQYHADACLGAVSLAVALFVSFHVSRHTIVIQIIKSNAIGQNRCPL